MANVNHVNENHQTQPLILFVHVCVLVILLRFAKGIQPILRMEHFSTYALAFAFETGLL